MSHLDIPNSSQREMEIIFSKHQLLIIKTGRKDTHVQLNWWTKSLYEHRAAWAEMNKTKVGRRTRITNSGEYVVGPAPKLAYLTHENSKDGLK